MFGSGATVGPPALALAAAVTTVASESDTDADLTDRVDDVFDVVIAELGRKWERQGPCSDPLRVREVTRLETERLAVIVMQVDRSVVNAGAHVPPNQLVQHLVTTFADRLGLQEDRVEVSPVDCFGLDGRGPHHGKGFERLVVSR